MLDNLHLRTKFLWSLALVTGSLTCATLLVVRHSAQLKVQREIEEDAQKAILTIQTIQHQHQSALNHKADLLATLARMRNGDASSIKESTDDPWRSEDSNLFALADRDSKILALHTTTPGFPVATAEELLHETLQKRSTHGWWYSGAHLYQVVLQSISDGRPPWSSPAGIVVVGREIDVRQADTMREISSSQVVFRYGQEVVVSTLSPLQEQEFTQQIHDHPSSGKIQIDGEWFWASSVGLTPDAAPDVTLTVLHSYTEEMAFLARLNHLLEGLGLVAVLLGGALVFFISDAFTRPLAQLAEGVSALEQGDFKFPLDTRGKDEVAQVTRAFDHMRDSLQRNEAKRQELEGRLRQAERMQAMGRLAGGVAHDFNNLLTIIKGHSELLLERSKSSDVFYGSSQQIVKAADRAASLTRQLLAFSRMQVLQPKVVDLNALVADMGKMMARLIREDIAFSFRPGESLGRVKADQSQIEQVILNLVVNACDAMPRGGKLTIETVNMAVDESFAHARAPMQAGEYITLSVTDTGFGMDAETRARIFEPFFTTKEVGKGTGLGLATVYGVVKQSGGYIWVESEPGKGARFEIYLPRVSERAEPARQQADVARPGRRRKTILIAEDEEAVRDLASEFLKADGYEVLIARDGKEALAIANRSGEPIHVLVTDVVMPNVRGPELAKRMKALCPKVKIVYTSGYLEYDKGNGEFLEEGQFLQKPFTRADLVGKVDEALNRQATNRPSVMAISHTENSQPAILAFNQELKKPRQRTD